MKSLKITILGLIVCLGLSACTRELSNDARQTPIGSVFTGETTSTGEYFQKVSEQNRNSDRNPWRPKTDDRF